MKTHFRRWLPGLCALALLLVALIAPSRGVRARPAPVLDNLPACGLPLQQGGDNATQNFVNQEALYQAFPVGGTAVSCALYFDLAPYSSGRSEVLAWDPNLLKPRAGVLALRSRGFSASELQYSQVAAMSLSPPIVGDEQPGIAEPMGSQLVLKYSNTGFGEQNVHYDTDGPAGIPEAYRLSNTTIFTLAGNHPVLTHQICGGDASMQALRVVQSVITSDVSLGDAFTYEITQRFRLPVATQVRWIEFPSTNISSNGVGVISVVDAAGQNSPPLNFGTPLGSANFNQSSSSTWRTHFDFDTPFALEAEHDYWLVFRTQGKFFLYARNPTGADGPEFDRVGNCFGRYYDGYSWAQYALKDLNFRIIGAPPGTAAVGPVAPSRAAFALAAAPNPARRATALSWSGAKGGVRFEVLDARGRRVAEGASVAGESGRWTWSGAGDDGRPLPAGLYFVRARDESGRSTSARVTVVR